MTFPVVISLFSILFSGTALYFTFKKDAHRIRLRSESVPERWFDKLIINNDSGFAVQLSAVGHIGPTGDITWLERVGDAKTNKGTALPLEIGPRSTFSAMVTHNIHTFPQGHIYGFCVQLACGRTSVAVGNLPRRLAYTLKAKAILSRISSGGYGFPMSDIQYKPYVS